MADDTKTNDDQAQALIDALAPKLAESLLPQLHKQVEDQLSGIKDKNQELLQKLAEAKQAPDMTKLLEAAEAQLKARMDGQTFDTTPKPMTISKADARNHSRYRAAKAAAEKAGTTLVIEGR